MKLFALAVFGIAAFAQGPSFSCAHVTSKVNQLICASPSLGALDRELADTFGNMRGQPIDQKKLQADETAWLAGMRHDCSDAPCIEQKYKTRIAELRQQSLRAASPAAFEQTKPFPAPAALMAEARAAVGKPCSAIAGFTRSARFLPVILRGGVTEVRQKAGVRFAFLIVIAGPDECEVRDVVALPASAVGDRFLQCSESSQNLVGFGLRNAQTHGLDAFWSVDPDQHALSRVPMAVLGIEKSVRCRQPEGAE